MVADSVNPGNVFIYNQATATGNAGYLWDFGDGTISTLQYPTHQYAAPGQYVVCLAVSATNGTTSCYHHYCDSSSVQKPAAGFLMSQVTVLPPIVTTIKKESTTGEFKIFPNPFNDELIIEIKSEHGEKFNITLVDALGKKVLTKSISQERTSMNTSQLDKGFYFMTVTDATGKALKTIKLVK